MFIQPNASSTRLGMRWLIAVTGMADGTCVERRASRPRVIAHDDLQGDFEHTASSDEVAGVVAAVAGQGDAAVAGRALMGRQQAEVSRQTAQAQAASEGHLAVTGSGVGDSGLPVARPTQMASARIWLADL